MINTLEVPFRIVTPMFLGGADQKASIIRPSSIKGALRFWWRALNWGRCLHASQQNEVQALRLLHAEEARLFGAAASDTAGGQGVFLMSVAQETPPVFAQPFSPFAAGQLYLLGMGLATFKEGSQCPRNALDKGGAFTLKLIFHPKASPQDVQQVKDAVQAFELLGALGTRARHGLGSVASPKPMTCADYAAAIQALFKHTSVASALPPFSACSAHTRIDISATANDPLKLLDQVGREQQLYRSYGRQGLVNGQRAERNFAADHDMVMRAISAEATPTTAPQRAVFGLPHNYFFSSIKDKADVNYVTAAAKRGGEEQEARRASPLLLHIHPVSDGGFVAVHTLIPAKFLPDGARIQIKAGGRKFSVAANPDWTLLHNYLNRFQNKREVIHGGR